MYLYMLVVMEVDMEMISMISNIKIPQVTSVFWGIIIQQTFAHVRVIRGH